MNYGRLALAARRGHRRRRASTDSSCMAMLLSGEFAKYPGDLPLDETQTAFLPLMFVGILVAMLVASYLYAKGYEGGSGLQEGMRFGVLIGLFIVGYVAGVNYAIMNIGKRMAACYAVAGLVEWVVVGMVIGFVYQPAAPAARVRAAGAGV